MKLVSLEPCFCWRFSRVLFLRIWECKYLMNSCSRFLVVECPSHQLFSDVVSFVVFQSEIPSNGGYYFLVGLYLLFYVAFLLLLVSNLCLDFYALVLDWGFNFLFILINFSFLRNLCLASSCDALSTLPTSASIGSTFLSVSVSNQSGARIFLSQSRQEYLSSHSSYVIGYHNFRPADYPLVGESVRCVTRPNIGCEGVGGWPIDCNLAFRPHLSGKNSHR